MPLRRGFGGEASSNNYKRFGVSGFSVGTVKWRLTAEFSRDNEPFCNRVDPGQGGILLGLGP